jgi:GT2 family glycosyltransferase
MSNVALRNFPFFPTFNIQHSTCKTPPALSVVIPTWNGKHLLAGCLESLRAQTVFERIETIVVDNGSHDGTAEMLAAGYPWVRCLALAENRGFAGGCNAGMRAALSPLVALLNNDASADAAWAGALIAAAEKYPEAGSFASSIRAWSDVSVLESAGDFFSVFGWAGHVGLNGRPANFVDSKPFGACACASMYRKAALDDVGLFDEDLFVSHEDVDLAFRLRLAGYDCRYVPDAVVRHKGFGTRGTSASTLFLSRRNQLIVLLKNMPTALLILLSPLLLLGQFLGLHSRFASIGFFKSLPVILKARWAAMGMMGGTWRKRRGIQRKRRVSAIDLLKLFRWWV